ncbi:hypothetical protein DFH07DRAFT_367681 [Mycena maculata]|uniref:Uncharacterized protein n=1 Tax=Mycena maculata TaxID=230809 RepID=A0AAD7NLA5_9AGAR|nr:hypothetical protein DFH07DRAFT_367681 [Mycena maculata]
MVGFFVQVRLRRQVSSRWRPGYVLAFGCPLCNDRISCHTRAELTRTRTLHISHSQDDSSTLSALAIRAGTGPYNLQDVRMVISAGRMGGSYSTSHPNRRTIAERYTHVRRLRVLGPLEEAGMDDDPFLFQAPRFKMYETIR